MMTFNSAVSCIILAGGDNSRIGFFKAHLQIGERSIIETQMSVLEKLFEEIIIVTNNPDNFETIDAKIVKDIVSGKGPLGGLYSGLSVCSNIYSFLLGCDMPFINLRLLKYMISQIDGSDIVIPRSSKGVETLFAIYSLSCLESIMQQIDTRRLKLADLLDSHKVRFIPRDEIQNFDQKELSFFNINTPKNYEEAKNIWKRTYKDNQTL